MSNAWIVFGGDGADTETNVGSKKDGEGSKGRGKRGEYKYVAPKGNSERVNLDEEPGNDKEDPGARTRPDRNKPNPAAGRNGVPAPSMPIKRDGPAALPRARPKLSGPISERGKEAIKERLEKKDDESDESDDSDDAPDDDEEDDEEAEEEDEEGETEAEGGDEGEEGDNEGDEGADEPEEEAPE